MVNAREHPGQEHAQAWIRMPIRVGSQNWYIAICNAIELTRLQDQLRYEQLVKFHCTFAIGASVQVVGCTEATAILQKV